MENNRIKYEGDLQICVISPKFNSEFVNYDAQNMKRRRRKKKRLDGRYDQFFLQKNDADGL